jgi:hypothetical protein
VRAPLVRRIVVGLAALAAAVSVILIVVWFGPQWLTPPNESIDRLKAMQDVRSSLIQLLAGIGLFGGFVVTIRTFALNRRGQITDRFSKAVEQLGGALDVRVGGIYALERVLHESADDHQPIVEILCAFIREHAKLPAETPSVGESWVRGSVPDGVSPPQPDVQAALTVLGRRPVRHEPNRPDIRRTDLRQAYLHGVNFDHFILNNCLFDYVDMGEAKLSNASLRGAMFRHAWLRAADLNGAELRNSDFSWAYVVDANLPSRDELEKANFDRVILLA